LVEGGFIGDANTSDSAAMFLRELEKTGFVVRNAWRLAELLIADCDRERPDRSVSDFVSQ
jgi:hypothetical protein